VLGPADTDSTRFSSQTCSANRVKYASGTCESRENRESFTLWPVCGGFSPVDRDATCRKTEIRGWELAAHRLEIWRYLRFLGCEAHLANDLVQEVFLCAMHASYVDRGLRARARWLRGIARNLYLKQMRRPVPEVLDEAEATWVRHCDEDGGNAYVDALRVCLARLPPRLRHAIDLRYAQGSSREEMARALSLRGDGVKSLLRRARHLLRTCIERRMR
jgi:RNA polymerase sigma-70 factor (ECF subfamily)